MIKWICLLLFLCSFVVQQAQAQPYLHKKATILKHRIKSIKKYEVSREDGVLVKDTTYEYFDREGRKTSSVFGHGKWRSQHQYDTHGNDTYTLFDYPGSKSEYKNTFEYDASGRMVRQTDLVQNYVITFEYDEKGRLVKELLAGGAPKLFLYDAGGRLGETYHEDKGRKIFREVFEYTSNGDTLKHLKFDQGWSGSDTVVTTWKYLPDGVIEKTENKESTLVVSTYNKNWDYISIVTTMRNGTIKKALECVYDNKGMLLESTMNEKYRSVYSYNSQGLVVKEVKTNLKTGEQDYYTAVYDYSFFE